MDPNTTLEISASILCWAATFWVITKVVLAYKQFRLERTHCEIADHRAAENHNLTLEWNREKHQAQMSALRASLPKRDPWED